MNRERLIADAKAVALARAQDYVAPRPRPAIPVGGEGLQAALKLGVHLAWRAGRLERSRRPYRPDAGADPVRRRSPARRHRQRTGAARSRARSIPEPVRAAQDAGADRLHAQDRKDAEELTRDLRSRGGAGGRGRARRTGPMGVDEASTRRARRPLSNGLVLALRRHRLGREVGPFAGLRQLSRPARRGAQSPRSRACHARAASRSVASSRCAMRPRIRIVSAHSCSCRRPHQGGRRTRSRHAGSRGPGSRRRCLSPPRRCGSGRKCGRHFRPGRRAWDSSCVRDCARRARR